MKILQKKICLLGDFGVGKTSLVARFVNNEYSEKYLTTVGVKMDTKLIAVNDELSIKLIIWDIAGENSLKKISQTYLRGAAGFLLVIDGTRMNTLDGALDMKRGIRELLGDIPFVVLLNKYDLTTQWELTAAHIERLNTPQEQLFFTSAKSGEQVEAAFNALSYVLTL
ncbi:MAG: Rab family GTPase [Methylococcales bacterium]|nr:Rab family GTPase [Methylococcales bacterium]MDP3009069.1 Rab family GTPase [Methylococcales bacterium]